MIMLYIFKENIQPWTEKIKFMDLSEKKLCNVTMFLIKFE